MSPERNDPLFIRSVEKAFRVLAVFNKHPEDLSLRDVSNLTGFNKSTAQRFCHTLNRLGYLRRVPGSSAYELAVKTTEIGAGFISSNKLVRLARPYLHTLSIETEGTASLALLDGNEVVFVSRFPGKYVLDTTVTVGSRLPIYCTASGRAAASMLDDKNLQQVLKAQSWRSRTIKTDTNPASVKRSILLCRKQGYVLTCDQYVLSDLSLAVPFLDQQAELIGTVTLSLSTARFQIDEVEEQFVKLVQTAARAITG